MFEALLPDILVILGLSAVILFVCHRLGVSTIVGFLLAGVLAGPHGLSLVSAAREVEALAEIGVVLLLFTIGIEFSLDALSHLRRPILIGGTAQAFTTMAGTTLLLVAGGATVPRAVLFGMLTSLSSTAIVLKVLHRRGEIDTMYGRFTVGVLIFQDLLVVAMLLAVPLLAGAAVFAPSVAVPLILKAVAVLGGIFLAARWVLPQILHQVARTRDPELFLAAVVVLGLGIAYLTYEAGLSLAMGAFLAGLILSASPYAQNALGNLLPLRDLFMSFFFVSVGMLFDVRVLLLHPLIILGGALFMVVFKGLLATLSGILAGIPLRSAVIAGIALAEVGEFSFILATAALGHEIIDRHDFQLFLGASALSMIAAPFLIDAAPRLAEWVAELPWPRWMRTGVVVSDDQPPLQNHLLIIGYGLVGRHLAEAALASRIPYLVLDANPDIVSRERALGRPIVHCDATQEAALAHARARDARVAVIAISDAMGTRRIVDRLRALSPTLHIIARTRYFADVEALIALGASEVIPEEYEASIEIFTRVLHKYLVPKEQVEGFAEQVRSSGYAMLREPALQQKSLAELDLFLSDMEVRVMCIEPLAGAVGHSLAELDLRRMYGIMVLAIRRGGASIQLPDGVERFAAGDEVVLLGLPELLPFAVNIFRAPAGLEKH